MTMGERVAQIRERLGAVPRDRYAELLVILVVAAGLIVGWGVKAGAQARAVHIEVAGLRASYGHDWIRQEPNPPDVLKIVDPASGARVPTTIAVRVIEDAGAAPDVARALNQGRLFRQELFQSLSGEEVELRGRTFYRNEFSYVYVSPDLLHPALPVVVHGVDYILPHGTTTYVITLVADGNAYDGAMAAMMRFLRSMSLA